MPPHRARSTSAAVETFSGGFLPTSRIGWNSFQGTLQGDQGVAGGGRRCGGPVRVSAPIAMPGESRRSGCHDSRRTAGSSLRPARGAQGRVFQATA